MLSICPVFISNSKSRAVCPSFMYSIKNREPKIKIKKEPNIKPAAITNGKPKPSKKNQMVERYFGAEVTAGF